MAILLSLETSTGVCSAAIHENGKLMAATQLHINRSASAQLAVIVNDLLKLCCITPGEMDGIAISAGPGSYTGLRIGVATAKGFCFALNIPLMAVNTLQLMVYQLVSSQLLSLHSQALKSEKLLLCPMLDARRMEVYCLLSDIRLNIMEETTFRIIDEKSFDPWLAQGPVLFFGNGSEKCKDIISHPRAVFIDGVVPMASKLGELAFRKFEDKSFEDLASFEPYYLKDFVVKKPKA